MNVGMEQILNWETIPGPFINYIHHTKTGTDIQKLDGGVRYPSTVRRDESEAGKR